MFEPEEFLETLDRMISLNMDLLAAINSATSLRDLDIDEDVSPENLAEAKQRGSAVITEDLARLRDLHNRIQIQFDLTKVIVN